MTETSQRLGAMIPRLTGASIVAGPYNAMTWDIDQESFVAAVTEYLRRNDLIPLDLLASEVALAIQHDVAEHGASVVQRERVLTILDRLTAIGAIAIRFNRYDLFSIALSAFLDVYNLGFNHYGASALRGDLAENELWFETIQRVAVLGGMAVRFKRWPFVRDLVLQRGRGDDFVHYSNWYRHAGVFAAQGDLMRERVSTESEQPRHIDRGFLHFAHLVAQRLEVVRPGRRPDDPSVLNWLIQFDYLASVIAATDALATGDEGRMAARHGAALYPNFARYRSERTMPIADELVRSMELKLQLTGITDAGDTVGFSRLAEAMDLADKLAQSEGRRYHGWHGYSDSVTTFVRMHEG